LAANSADATTRITESVDKAWDVLKESRDQNVVGRFAEKYPSWRKGRLPAGSDLALRPVSSTEWMMCTASDADVFRCFAGESPSCVAAIDKFPDFVQLRFQLCRTAGLPNGCMQDAVEDARQRGYLVSAYTRSDKEKTRNLEYRKTVASVRQNVSNIASNAASSCVSNAALAPPLPAGTGKWDVRLNSFRPAGAVPTGGRPKSVPPVAVAPKLASIPAVAGSVASGAASSVTSKPVRKPARKPVSDKTASTGVGRTGSHAAGNAAGRHASDAAGRAASNAASHAAGRAASSSASSAAGRAASSAASHATSRIPSDIRLKRDITEVARTDGGLRLYRYRYIGDHTFYVGVMAQDVAEQVPAAVTQADDGFLQVDYGLLGLKFLTYRNWMKLHPISATAAGRIEPNGSVQSAAR